MSVPRAFSILAIAMLLTHGEPSLMDALMGWGSVLIASGCGG